jgi:hypothetical protein
MIETHTSWKETSHDCQYCGGIILQRTDFEDGQKVRACLQCRDCGTQWSLHGSVLRLGRRRPAPRPEPQRLVLPRWLPYAGGALVLVWVLMLTGLIGLVARLLIPLLILGLLGFFVYQLGLHYGWWKRPGGGPS